MTSFWCYERLRTVSIYVGSILAHTTSSSRPVSPSPQKITLPWPLVLARPRHPRSRLTMLPMLISKLQQHTPTKYGQVQVQINAVIACCNSNTRMSPAPFLPWLLPLELQPAAFMPWYAMILPICTDTSGTLCNRGTPKIPETKPRSVYHLLFKGETA